MEVPFVEEHEIISAPLMRSPTIRSKAIARKNILLPFSISVYLRVE
jgi:hypothetical protein